MFPIKCSLVCLLLSVILWCPAADGADSTDKYRNPMDPETLIAKAAAGDADAQFLVGGMYYQGEGMPKNVLEAAKYFKMAADQNEPKAQFLLGYLYYKGEGVKENFELARELWEKSANAGYDKAIDAMAQIKAQEKPVSALDSKIPLKPHDLLLEAVKHDKPHEVQAALAAGANPDTRDAEGSPVLLLTAAKGDVVIAKLLIEAGADIEAQDKQGRTLLEVCPSLDVIKKLGAVHGYRMAQGYSSPGAPSPPMPEDVPSTPVKPSKPPFKPVSFRLTERFYAHDSLQTHKDLWVAMMLSNEDGGKGLNILLQQYISGNKVIPLAGGTEVTLTGRATGAAAEITITGRPEKWCIPLKALKDAGISVPPTDYAYMDEQLTK